jgi:hypothetical protein
VQLSAGLEPLLNWLERGCRASMRSLLIDAERLTVSAVDDIVIDSEAQRLPSPGMVDTKLTAQGKHGPHVV